MSEHEDAPATASVAMWRRVVAAVRWVEAQARGGGGWNRKVPQWTPSVVRAYVTTAIPAGTKASPSSSGRAQVMSFDGSAWYDSGSPVVVYNDHTFCSGVTTVAVNKVVKLSWIAGQWWLLAADN